MKFTVSIVQEHTQMFLISAWEDAAIALQVWFMKMPTPATSIIVFPCSKILQVRNTYFELYFLVIVQLQLQQVHRSLLVDLNYHVLSLLLL